MNPSDDEAERTPPQPAWDHLATNQIRMDSRQHRYLVSTLAIAQAAEREANRANFQPVQIFACDFIKREENKPDKLTKRFFTGRVLTVLREAR